MSKNSSLQIDEKTSGFTKNWSVFPVERRDGAK
jgi:hypothetical protein